VSAHSFDCHKPFVQLGWRSQPARIVTLEDCRVPATNMLGKIGGGFQIAMQGLNGGRVNIGRRFGSLVRVSARCQFQHHVRWVPHKRASRRP
jgi:alkylation response protein AidB-like acyl-CoA dehydrogenase